jgi:hypothetical protein
VTQPVGPEYGLEPRLDHTIVEPAIESRDLLFNPYLYNDPIASEFGGVPGLVQPAPHTPSATERLSAIYAIDPCDDGAMDGSVAPPETDGNFNSEY